MRSRTGALRAFDLSGASAQIALPTPVIAARNDVLVRYRLQPFASGIPGARLELAPEGGHVHSAADPVAFNAVLLSVLGSSHTDGILKFCSSYRSRHPEAETARRKGAPSR